MVAALPSPDVVGDDTTPKDTVTNPIAVIRLPHIASGRGIGNPRHG